MNGWTSKETWCVSLWLDKEDEIIPPARLQSYRFSPEALAEIGDLTLVDWQQLRTVYGRRYQNYLSYRARTRQFYLRLVA